MDQFYDQPIAREVSTYIQSTWSEYRNTASVLWDYHSCGAKKYKVCPEDNNFIYNMDTAMGVCSMTSRLGTAGSSMATAAVVTIAKCVRLFRSLLCCLVRPIVR